jgi:transposase
MNHSCHLAIGIDIAKDTLAVCAQSMTETPLLAPMRYETSNTSEGHHRLLTWIAVHNVAPSQTHVVMEATNVYWELCALTLVNAGYVVSVVNPTQTSHFAKSILMRGKTDRMDAELLARYAAEKQPRPWTPPSAALEELQALVQRREALIHMRSEERSRMHALEHRAHPQLKILKQITEHITFLNTQIEHAEDDSRELLRRDPVWANNLALLQSVQGIGIVTATALISHVFAVRIPDTPRQLTAYAGLAPAPNQSGTSLRGRTKISKIGDPYLRKILYMASLTAVKHNPRLRDFYQRLIAHNKPKKLALLAVARKLLITAYALIVSQQAYDPEYVRTKVA